MPSQNNLIKDILFNGTSEEKRAIFSFSLKDSNETIVFKFKLFSRVYYPHYFDSDMCEEHNVALNNFIDSYRGENVNEIGFRGFAKTTIAKLFIAFVLLNDQDNTKKFIKFLCKDLGNAKQAVTDIYNLMVTVKDIYGDMFEQAKDIKREETMSSFTTKDGVKLTASQIGKTQRGNVQDAFRPDWLVFDDVEDSESISSIVQTEFIIKRVDEAIQGLALNGSYVLLGNYISDSGVVQYFVDKGNKTHIVPIIDAHGNPTWDRFSKEKIEQLKRDALDWAGDYLCLKPDTKVLTETGYMEIKDLQVGDSVITHKGRKRKILKVMENNAKDLLDITVNGVTTSITKEHPVLVRTEAGDEWVEAGNLKKDDLVVVIPHDKHMQTAKIQNIQPSQYSGVVFNIEVEEDNSYTLEGFVVHNCNPSLSGDKFFDIQMVENDIKNATEPILKASGVSYWSNYKPNHRYAIGLDLSDGVGSDSCALSLFDFDEGLYVGSYDTNVLEPDLFTHEAMNVGEKFGECLIAPEINNTAGGIAISTLKERQYPRIYKKIIEDSAKNVLTDKLGWHTNRKTKPQMFYNFKRDYEDGLIKIKDKRLLTEMKNFNKSDLQDTRTSAITRHFDLLVSACIAWEMKDHAGHTRSVKDFYHRLGKTESKTKARR